jgi:hypothetical protein
VSIFTEAKIPLDEQEALLWQLPSAQQKEISLEIEKKLAPHFKKGGATKTLQMIQEKEMPATHFSLRDEIAAAISEADTDKNLPFLESFFPSKIKQTDF